MITACDIPHKDRMEAILNFWFGHVEETLVPSEDRSRIWFGEDNEVDEEIRTQFSDDLSRARDGEYAAWKQNARSQLALIILLDQFSRHIYRHQAAAYSQDPAALVICLKGAQAEEEHVLSLIERVFYYYPLLHAEDLYIQEQALNAYGLLAQYALEETQAIYDSFLKFAQYHHDIISRFGRFPLRNEALGRESTQSELAFLASLEER